VARRPVLENAVMEVLWQADTWLTPAEVQKLIADRHARAYTTVLTTLTRLWRKGRLERQPSGKAYAYRPLLTREQFSATRMEAMLDIADDHSAALNRFVDSLSPDERGKLKKYLEET